MQNTPFKPYPIQWHEGMLLMPQHFQQTDLLQRRLLSYHLSQLSPYHWGVKKLQIDMTHLVNGLFRILQIEAILPDGTVIFFPQDEKDTLEINLTQAAPQIQDNPVYIYLILPEEGIQDIATDAAYVRYEPEESALIPDFSTRQDAVTIARLKPRLALAAGTEPPAHHVCLPLAQVEKRSNAYALTTYIPPYMHVTPTSPLGLMCAALIKKIRDKLAYLQRKIQSISIQQSYSQTRLIFETEEARKRLIIGMLPFEALLETGLACPHDLFALLTNLAAQGVAICRGMYPPKFQLYKHEDQNRSFQDLIVFCEEILNNIEETHSAISFIQSERLYSLVLKTEWDSPFFVLGARAAPGMSESDLVKWVQGCVIASDSFVHHARDKRVLGASREIVSEVPSLNLVAPHGSILCLVKNDPNFIHITENLHIFNASDKPNQRPKEITLYAQTPFSSSTES